MGTGWTYWKATDETLARSVTVLTFAPGFPRVAETVTAARAASRLGDPRFAQVFDVEDGDELAYVVLEWVARIAARHALGRPARAARAAALMVEAARAIAAAHDIGLAHLRLDPACLHWTPGGGVKIAGLGIDAALAGPDLTAPDDGAETRELTDTRDLARLLYAALTGYWPGQPGSAGSAPGLLPPAPENGGGLCTPRQVAAGVPAGVDDVTCRALFQRPNRHGPALSTAAMFADALASAAPPVPLPFAPRLRCRQDRPARLRLSAGRVDQLVPAAGRSAAHPAEPRPAGRRPQAARRALRRGPRHRQRRDRACPGGGRSGRLVDQPQPAPLGGPGAEPAALVVAGRGRGRAAQAGQREQLQPARQPPGSNEDSADTGNVIDGSASTFWHTSYYVGNPSSGA